MNILGFNFSRGASAPKNATSPTPKAVSPPPSAASPHSVVVEAATAAETVVATGGAESGGIATGGTSIEGRGEGSLARSARVFQKSDAAVEALKQRHEQEAEIESFREEAIAKLKKNGNNNPDESQIRMSATMLANKARFERRDTEAKAKADSFRPVVKAKELPPEDPRILKFGNALYTIRGHVAVQPSFIHEILKRAGVPCLLTPEQKTLFRQLTEENNGYLAELSSATHSWVMSEWGRLVSENERAAQKGEPLPHNVPLRDQMHILAEQKRHNIKGKMRSVSQRRFDLVYRPALEKLREISLQVCEQVEAAERAAQFTGTGLPWQPSPGLKILAWFCTEGVKRSITAFVAGTMDIMGTKYLTDEILLGDEVATLPAKLQVPENPLAEQMRENQRKHIEALKAMGISV